MLNYLTKILKSVEICQKKINPKKTANNNLQNSEKGKMMSFKHN